MLYRCNYCHIGWESDDTEVPKLCDHCHTGTPVPAEDEPEREPPRSRPVFPKSDYPMPNIVSDKMTKHFDWSCGETITSRSQRNRIYAEKGLVPRSYSEIKRQHGGLERRRNVVVYPGKTDHRSSAEKKYFETDEK